MRIGLVIEDNSGEKHFLDMVDVDVAAASNGDAKANSALKMLDWGQAARCAIACESRSGYGACVARCVATGDVCDGGTDNCRRL